MGPKKRLSHEYDSPSHDFDMVWKIYEILKARKSNGKCGRLAASRTDDQVD